MLARVPTCGLSCQVCKHVQRLMGWNCLLLGSKGSVAACVPAARQVPRLDVVCFNNDIY